MSAATAGPGGPARPLRVLIVEDSEMDALLMVQTLKHAGYNVRSRVVATALAMRDALSGESWDVIISDHKMPDFSSTEALELAKGMRADIPFIIVSGSIGEEIAVEAMRAGARDYILKGNLLRLAPAIDRELREAVERRERRRAEQALFVQAEQMHIAREIQQRMFPVSAPRVPGCDLAGASRPADATGGDYFDFIRMVEGQLLVAIGDVTGHGLGAALLMAETREALRALALASDDIREIHQRAGKLLRADFGDEHFMTLLLLQIDPAAGTLRYVNAGHPAGHMVGADGTVRHVLASHCPAVGLMDDPPAPPETLLHLEAGDVVVLLTDGVIEALSPAGEEFGIERALSVVRASRSEPASSAVSRVFESVAAFQKDAGQMDDVTLVILKWNPV